MATLFHFLGVGSFNFVRIILRNVLGPLLHFLGIYLHRIRELYVGTRSGRAEVAVLLKAYFLFRCLELAWRAVFLTWIRAL